MATKTKPLPEFITVRQISEALVVSKYTVYRLIEKGELESKRFGQQIRVTRESFDRYVENAG